MQELIDYVDSIWSNGGWEETIKEKAKELIEKEKEQMIAAVRYGQNNYKENLYEEGELYYNEIYNSDAPFIKSSIPNGNIKYNQNK